MKGSYISLLSFAFFVFFALMTLVQAQTPDTPYWMNEGTFVQYEFKSAGFTFLNGTIFPFRNDAAVIWRWECTEVNHDLVTLNVTVDFTEDGKSVLISAEVTVNTTTMQVFLPNGTLIGTTHLWGKAYPADGEEIVVWDAPPDRIVGVVEIKDWVNTPQGAQKAYSIKGTGTINSKSAIISTLNEIDTGIMVDGFISSEATLYALDIDSPLVNGRFNFSDTNIDLGPKELWPEILPLIPIVISVIVFIVLLIIFHNKRKRR